MIQTSCHGKSLAFAETKREQRNTRYELLMVSNNQWSVWCVWLSVDEVPIYQVLVPVPGTGVQYSTRTVQVQDSIRWQVTQGRPWNLRQKYYYYYVGKLLSSTSTSTTRIPSTSQKYQYCTNHLLYPVLFSMTYCRRLVLLTHARELYTRATEADLPSPNAREPHWRSC